jgi:hypothetical protein
MNYTRLTTLIIPVFTHLATLNYPSEHGIDRFDYLFDGWLTHLTTLGYPWMLCSDLLDHPSDGWLAGLTTLVILGCYALTRLTTPSMAG